MDRAEYNAIVKHPCNKGCAIPDDYRERSAFCVSVLIEPLTALAKEHGYNLGVRGSLVRDIDLVAVPWETFVSDPIILAEEVRKKTESLVGHAIMCPGEDGWRNIAGCPGGKPHGRLQWIFHLGGGPYIDLAIFPPVPRNP